LLERVFAEAYRVLQPGERGLLNYLCRTVVLNRSNITWFGLMLRVLIIGVGSIGERHVRCFKRTGRAQVSICEVNADVRQKVASRYDIAHTYSSLHEALDDACEAAVICTPAQLHIPLAIELAQRGVHLLIEKPLSTSMEGIEDLQLLVRQRGISVMVGYVWRMHPALARMRELIASGRFGRPLQIISVAGQHFPTYRPAYRDIYYRDRATGGGAIQDALTHNINAGEWLVGPITRLVCDASHQFLEGVEVEDTVHLLARHGSVLGSYSLNQYQAPQEWSFKVVCEGGTIFFTIYPVQLKWMSEPDGEWQEEIIPATERDDLFVKQANLFLDVIEGKASPSCSLQEAIQTLRVNLAALQSVLSRQWVEIG